MRIETNLNGLVILDRSHQIGQHIQRLGSLRVVVAPPRWWLLLAALLLPTPALFTGRLDTGSLR